MRRPPDLPSYLPSIHREGYLFVAIAGFATLVLFFISSFLGFLGLLVMAGVALFFRDPERIIPEGEHIALSPADGRVCAVGMAKPPAELKMGETPLLRIGVFMSLLDAHINRMPLAGRIAKRTYRPGAFFNAASVDAGERNERISFEVETKQGERVAVVQIAGLVARRIVAWCEEGEDIEMGERIGLIRFGSRADVFLPEGWEARVKIGQTMVAGESVIAEKIPSNKGDNAKMAKKAPADKPD